MTEEDLSMVTADVSSVAVDMMAYLLVVLTFLEMLEKKETFVVDEMFCFG